QVYVSQLRSLLGPDAIETVSPGYRLRAEEGTTDAGRFARLLEEGQAALADGNPELARALAGRALALWRGPALAEVAYEPFAERDAARLEDLRLECIEDQLEAELAVGGHERVLARLTQLTNDHPLRERARGRLALALYRCGRQADALAVLADTRRTLRDELGLDPSRDLTELEQRILVQDPSLDIWAAETATTALPVPPSPLVGRRDELAQLGGLVTRDDVRIITVSGAGGSGKTRVALEVARMVGSSFANGVAVVELAAVRDPSLVLATIAAAVGVGETADETPGVALRHWLSTRELLLVVDNFEHLIDAAAELANLARAAPRVTILVTSRRVLHVTGEHVYPLQPLRDDDAVTLFKLRATARDPARTFDAEADGVVGAICTRLDCLPLAVELAAARTASLEPRVLLDRLTHDVAALGVGPRDAPARQQTLADTVRWSTELLSTEERQALGRLSVFAGGCSLDDAEAVCEAGIETIAGLIDASLVRRQTSVADGRLTMLETIREHAVDLLVAAGERERTRAAHAEHFVGKVESMPFRGPQQPASLRWVDVELDNLRAAADGAEAAGDHTTALRIATALYRYWYVRGQLREGRDRIARALAEGAGDPTLESAALCAEAGLHYVVGELDEAVTAAQRGVEIGTACGATDSVMRSETVLGLVRTAQHDYEASRAHLERSAELARELGSEYDEMIANTNLGELALTAGDLPEARRRFEATLAWNEGRQDTDDTFARLGLGAVARRQGLLDEADVHFTLADELSERNGFPQNRAFASIGLAGVAADRGRFEDAALLVDRVDALLAATGGGLNREDSADLDHTRVLVLAALGNRSSKQ
ncbi:MAG: hypothetical protein QOE63_467, partial [Acidimicrobiaceae bacterium]